ncbi:MAG TPA: hypothetical protein VGP55_04255 [Chitinophagaceae bacterium]|nr:hypothetical protein [Chitinophagaceae bacterium]
MTLLQKINFRIRKFFPPPEVPGISEKRKLIDDFRKKYDAVIFIETGTFLGHTIDYFKNKFDKLYSIELSEDLAERAKIHFQNDHNVTIIQGDSADKLPGILLEIDNTALFWLDGHYSSEFFVNDEYIRTAKGEVNTPIIKELQLILASGLDFIILVDDARLFNGRNDYPTIKEIKTIINESAVNYTMSIGLDIIQIYPLLK